MYKRQVHLGAADEACNEHVARHIVQVLRGIDLLDDAILHDDDAVAHGHSLGLVVGNVDEGGSQLLVQLDDLGAHAGTQLGIQVGQGLVQQDVYKRQPPTMSRRTPMTPRGAPFMKSAARKPVSLPTLITAGSGRCV